MRASTSCARERYVMASSVLFKQIEKLGTAPRIDEALVATWLKAAKSVFSLPERGRTDFVCALGSVLNDLPGPAASKAPFGAALLLLLRSGNVKSYLGAAEILDYVLKDVRNAVFAGQAKALLDAVECGGAFIADVKKNHLGVRRQVDHGITKLLDLVDEVGARGEDAARFQALAVRSAHGWPGLGGSDFAARSDAFPRVLKQAKELVLAFPDRPGAEFLGVLVRAGHGPAVVARVLSQLLARPSAKDTEGPLLDLQTALGYMDAKLARSALKTVRDGASQLLALTEGIISKRATWTPKDPEYEETRTSVACAMKLLSLSGAFEDKKHVARGVPLLLRQSRELPVDAPSLNLLRQLGAASVPLLTDLLRSWLPRVDPKKAAASAQYSGPGDHAIAHVEECLYELFAHKEREVAASALIRDAGSWTAKDVQSFLTIVGSETHYQAGDGVEKVWGARGGVIARILPALSPLVLKNAAVKKLVDRARRAFGDAPAPKLPKKAPGTLDETFALLSVLGLGESEAQMSRGLDAKGVAALPEPLRALYLRTNGIGESVLKVTALAGLQKRFRRDVEQARKEVPSAWKRFSTATELFAFGGNGSGDLYFLDPARKGTVFRFDHEEQEASVDAKNVPAFVAKLLVLRWGALASKEKVARVWVTAQG